MRAIPRLKHRNVGAAIAGFGLFVVGLLSITARGEEAPRKPVDSRDGATKESPRSSKVERVESSRDLLVHEFERLPDGTTAQLTEEEYPEIYRLFREGIPTKEQPAQSSSKTAGGFGEASVRTVWMPGGVLSIVERPDGVMRMFVVALNYENPDLNSPDQGFAFTAIMTEGGAEVLSVNRDLLARFVGAGKEQNGPLGAAGQIANVDGGVASVEGGGFARFEESTTDDGVGQTNGVYGVCFCWDLYRECYIPIRDWYERQVAHQIEGFWSDWNFYMAELAQMFDECENTVDATARAVCYTAATLYSIAEGTRISVYWSEQQTQTWWIWHAGDLACILASYESAVPTDPMCRPNCEPGLISIGSTGTGGKKEKQQYYWRRSELEGDLR